MLYPQLVEVLYATRQLAKSCASESTLKQKYGPLRAKRLGARLQQLRVAETLADVRLVTTRVHELTDDLEGSIAIDLDGPYRLILEPLNWVTDEDGRLDWAAVDAVVITEITDYH